MKARTVPGSYTKQITQGLSLWDNIVAYVNCTYTLVLDVISLNMPSGKNDNGLSKSVLKENAFLRKQVTPL